MRCLTCVSTDEGYHITPEMTAVLTLPRNAHGKWDWVLMEKMVEAVVEPVVVIDALPPVLEHAYRGGELGRIIGQCIVGLPSGVQTDFMRRMELRSYTRLMDSPLSRLAAEFPRAVRERILLVQPRLADVVTKAPAKRKLLSLADDLAEMEQVLPKRRKVVLAAPPPVQLTQLEKEKKDAGIKHIQQSRLQRFFTSTATKEDFVLFK